MAPRKFSKRRPRFSKAKAKPKSGSTLVKTIKRVMAKQIEVKKYFTYGANQSINCANGSYPTAVSVAPLIIQGIGASQRIGNQLNVKSAVINGYVNILPYNSETNPNPIPVYVKIWLLSYKLTKTVTFTTTNADTSFFDTNNDIIGFQGNMLDLLFKPNYEVYDIHATKTIKIGGTSTSNFTVGYSDNSTMSAPFSFSYGKKLGKLKYEDDNIASPTNRSMFMVFQAVNANGTAYATIYTPAEYHFTNTISYTDA